LWDGWEDRHARVLGALLSVAARVKAVSPSVHLEGKPRMADFARVLAAVDWVLGTAGMSRYMERAGQLATDSLTGDAFVTALIERMTVVSASGEHEPYSSAELLALATPGDDEKWRVPKGWPADARQVTQLLRRQAPVMRRAGWTVDELPPGHTNVLRWRLAGPLPPAAEVRKQASQASQDQDPSGPDIGPCVRCGAGCRRYGPAGDSMCTACRGAA